VRYKASGAESDDLVATVRESINHKQIKDKTLVVEPLRPDSLLFIGNLTPEIDDAALRQMFASHGTVERAFVSFFSPASFNI
jgi:RNA recognition motif-containing protein